MTPPSTELSRAGSQSCSCVRRETATSTLWASLARAVTFQSSSGTVIGLSASIAPSSETSQICTAPWYGAAATSPSPTATMLRSIAVPRSVVVQSARSEEVSMLMCRRPSETTVV
ncbi:hypothetical protein H3H54_03500 [Brachybacterium sp. Z12]|uniref:hypothetical protein n=1 Tax=Brachybacterium sp. Z12 TaxID=2759167 RepID=UPI0018621267|nr:hypothetical protein [Brachybacterium sp. Z12]QNN82920.1 hypothetical protein H3H54_03500 [Brachybacterium sp. Z12]